MIRFILALALIFGLAAGRGHAADTDAADMMCANAPQGSVITLPAMISDWVTVVCTPTGQALAPAEKKQAALWIAKNDKPFMLMAFPASWQRPESISKYQMRFTRFFAVERSGEALEKTLKMWNLGFEPESRPQIERVVQLDAQSAWQGTLYNLFFYYSKGRPKWLIACINQCATSAPIRIVDMPQKQ